MEIPYSKAELVDAVKETIRANGLQSCYIRPIAFRGYGEMGVSPLANPVDVSIAVWPWGAYLGEEALEQGVRVKISSWRRHDQNSLPSAAKATGGYLGSILAKVDAIKSGHDEAVLLNAEGYVTEGSGENIFVVNGGALVTPHTGHGCLAGVTRSAVMTIARDLGFPVARAEPGSHRPLHGRRGVLHRHGGRDHARSARSTIAPSVPGTGDRSRRRCRTRSSPRPRATTRSTRTGSRTSTTSRLGSRLRVQERLDGRQARARCRDAHPRAEVHGAILSGTMQDRYRLPRAVVPARYDLVLEPDLEAATFVGSVEVAVEVHERVDEIVVNALELAIDEAPRCDATTVERST